MDIVCGLLARASTWRWVLREPVSAAYYADSWKASLRRWLGGGAAAVVANSKEGEGYWTDVLPEARTFVIPNGVPKDLIESAPDVEFESFGVPERCPCLLFVGRLERQKNLERLLLAFGKVRKSLPISLLICGDGSQRSVLEAKSRDLGVSARVVYAGYQAPQTVWGLMKKAAGLTLISEYEGFPNVLLEAMVCGCPILVSDIKEHREWLSPLEALWASPSDIDGIALALSRVVADREETMKRAARARVKAAEYTVTRMAEAYEKVYQMVA
jgi:glycosyltransferase involved in cell wall biosynthesis